MKVAFLSYKWAEYCMRLTIALSQEMDVCLFGPRPWAEHFHRLDQPVNFKPFDKTRFRHPIQQLRTAYKIVQMIKAFNPDVIHMQHGHLWFNFALPLLKQYPLVMTIHDPKHHLGDKASQKTPQKILDFGFRRANQIIVHTTQMAQMATERLGIAPEKIHVIPHVRIGDTRLGTNVAEDENLILFFGRIWEYKGLEYLIKAEPMITAQHPKTKIMIAGRGEDISRYQEMMVHPERFLIRNEYVSEEERSDLFRQASLVVLPYLEATQSGVIPIAYTFGKPVIATAVGGLPEQVDHGQTGFLVPPRNEHVLADKIIQLLQDKALRHQLGANGKHKLETEWSAKSVAQKTKVVYEATVNGKSKL